MMRRKGFTLIELMVVLTIIVIIATASVPQIQLWIARNRGLTAVATIISDFSKAKSMAAYSMTVNTDSLDADSNLQRSKLTTAIMFRKTSYSILQQSGTAAWHELSPLKFSKIPLNVSIESVNTEATNDNPGQSITLIFTSTGRLKKTNGALVLFGEVLGDVKCGALDSPLNGKRVFGSIIKSKVDALHYIWYRVEIDTAGEYFICMDLTSGAEPNFEADTANVVEL